MVSIEVKTGYLAGLKADTGLSDIIHFLFYGRPPEQDLNQDLQSIEHSTNALIRSICENNVDEFNKIEAIYIRKVPDFDSPWINSNYLIFFFLIGTGKFKKDRIWIKEAISKRRAADNEQQMIVDFFHCIINGVEVTNGYLAHFFIVYDFYTEHNQFDAIKINNGLANIRLYEFPFHESDFLNLLCLRSFDIILLAKGVTDGERQKKVDSFLQLFEKRVSSLAKILGYFLLFCFLIGVYFLLKYLFKTVEESLRNIVTGILGIMGVTVLEIFKLKRNLQKSIKKQLFRVFGYTILEEYERPK